MEKAIQCRGLSKSFRTHFYTKPSVVLKQISFDVMSSRATGFVGVNGAGKTTTIKCLMRFIMSDEGDIQIYGKDFRDPSVQKNWGFLPERPYYPGFLTAWEFLAFHWRLSNSTGIFDERANDLLKRVDLERAANVRLKSFSKGMLQRIGLAQALLASPRLLILDEPMSGLDPDGRFAVKEILKEEKSRGTTLFFSSHLLSDMEELCDDLVVIDQGRMVYNGALNQFVDSSSSLEISFQNRRKSLQSG